MPTNIRAATSLGGAVIDPVSGDGTLVFKTSAADGTASVDAISLNAAGRATVKGISDTVGISSTVGISAPYMQVHDEKNAGTDGGSSVGATVQVRTLNTVVYNTITGASLATNQVTLPAGTYNVSGGAAAFNVAYTKAVFYNVTDSVTAILGQPRHQTSDAYTANFTGRMVITGTKVFEVRQYTQNGVASNGLGINGVSTAIGVEVYTFIKITKVS